MPSMETRMSVVEKKGQNTELILSHILKVVKDTQVQMAEVKADITELKTDMAEVKLEIAKVNDGVNRNFKRLQQIRPM